MSEPVLQVEGLSLDLDGKRILDQVDLFVSRGEFLSIIGPNGAGKTSLIKCLSRIYTDWQGRALINGEEMKGLSQRDLARHLSYVPQAEGRSLPFTVFEFILMGRYPHLSPFSTIQAKDKEIVQEILELVGLEDFRDRVVSTLSGGERQMVFIAAALAQGASTLLLDEPASFLDYKHQAQVFDLLGRLNSEQGITIVSIGHDINTACAQSSQIMAMKSGSVLFVATPDEVLSPDRLRELYETEFEVADHPTKPGRRIAILKEET